jgi:hypothetical protein
MSKSRICPACEARLPAGATACPKCRAAVPADAVPDAILMDDDRPRSRRDDDDDRPPVRRRDEDDRPPPARPRRRRVHPLWIILGVAAVVTVPVAVVLVYKFVAGPEGASVPDDMLAWAPADSREVAWVDYGALRTTTARSGLTGLDDIRLHGLAPTEVTAILYASAPTGAVTVLRTNAPIDPARVVAADGRAPAPTMVLNGRTFYHVPPSGHVHFPSDRLMVVARSPMLLTERFVHGTDGTVVAGPEVRAALARGRGPAVLVNVAGGGDYRINGEAVRSQVRSFRLAGDVAEKTTDVEYVESAAAERAYDQARLAAAQPGQPWELRADLDGTRLTVRASGPVSRNKSGLQEFLFPLKW